MLRKHRMVRDWYAVDFANELEDGETITRVDALEVHQRYASTWTDKTEEFIKDDPVIVGSQVRFWLSAASEGEQRAGRGYFIYLRVITSTDRELVGFDGYLPRLEVLDEAKPAY